MHCKCGYFFMDIEAKLADPPAYPSFAVVNDTEYKKFLKHEVKGYQASSDKKKFKALAKAARYVGSLYICPKCARLAWLRPDAEGLEFYTREL